MVLFADQHGFDLQAVGQADQKFACPLVVVLLDRTGRQRAVVKTGQFFAVRLADVAPGGGILVVFLIEPLKNLRGGIVSEIRPRSILLAARSANAPGSTVSCQIPR